MATSQHDKVQYASFKWLESKGYKCEMERTFIISRGKKRVRVDVFGINAEGKTAVIECGHSFISKLNQLTNAFDTVYVWSLDASEPIIYNLGNDTDICGSCGCIKNYNNIGTLQFSLSDFIKLRLGNLPETDFLTVEDLKPIFVKKSRANRILEMRKVGATYEQIGKLVGLSKERVRQILPEGLRGKVSYKTLRTFNTQKTTK